MMRMQRHGKKRLEYSNDRSMPRAAREKMAATAVYEAKLSRPRAAQQATTSQTALTVVVVFLLILAKNFLSGRPPSREKA
jgi:hypothetical protein